MGEKITLDRICGYSEEKAEVRNIIELLKNYDKYEAQGVNIPRGLIFQGRLEPAKLFLLKL